MQDNLGKDMIIIRRFLTDDSGATIIEYGLITALVSVAGITAISAPAGTI